MEVRTLGAAELVDRASPGAPSSTIQPKRLALLAYLALAGRGRSRRRDRVVALFWPELDDAHARSALRQALSYLRRTLGPSAIATRGEDEVGIGSVDCDAVRFDEAVASGHCDEAMALYAGDFLDGLFVADASPELEEWVETERVRLRQSASSAACAVATSARTTGDRAKAVEWGRRAAALAPDDESRLRWLILLFDEQGDRGGALEAYDRFARRLMTEYACAPSAETQSLMTAVRDRTVSRGTVPNVEPDPAPSATDKPSIVPRFVAPADRPSFWRAHQRGTLAGFAATVLVAALATAVYWRVDRNSLPVVAVQTVRATAADTAAGQTVTALPPRSVDSVAFALYIRGRYWWNKRGQGLLRSIAFFDDALDRDPTFAPAYAGMADSYIQLGYASLLRPDDAFPKARAAAQRALELDPSLAEPHATLGFIAFYYEWDWPKAEREFQRALSADPGYATAHEWHGLYLAAIGRFDAAREEEKAAQALEPLSTAIAATAAWVEYYAGRNTEAERGMRIVLRTDSVNGLAHFYLGRVLQARGSLDLALDQYRATDQLVNWVPTVAAIGHVYGTQGRSREARAILSRLDSLRAREYVSAYAIALVQASLGQRDSAFAWLDRGVAERTHWMVWLRRDPRWASIKADPRFAALADRLRLPP